MSNPEERLTRIEVSIARIETNVENIETVVSNGLSKQIGKIFDKLEEKPCSAHQERLRGMSNRIGWLYFAFTIVILSTVVMGVWIKS